MRKVLKEALRETVQDLMDSGLQTFFTEKELKKLRNTDDEYINIEA